jgi:hypothetical protein|eukprot:7385097-Prymnesium_polylepis.1
MSVALSACARQDGRYDALTRCQAGLELCNRSLSDYLETKRKKFPRFYFISAADLVDILSKGKHPPAVQEHFSKFTDNTGAIEWDDDDGEPVTAARLEPTTCEGLRGRTRRPDVCAPPRADGRRPGHVLRRERAGAVRGADDV